MTGSNADPMPPKDPEETPSKRHLLTWPLSLVAMTAALLLVANVLSACGGHPRERPGLEEIKEHAAEGVEHLMGRLDGTEEQTDRLQAIVSEAVDALAETRGPREDLRAELARLLTADPIDRTAMEALRQQHLERAERMSAIVTTHLADALEVLTPEQRQQLQTRLAKHPHRGRWH